MDARSLDEKVDALERKVDQLPTRADLSQFATKDDLKRFATKDDLERHPTKDDLERYATKDDLVTFKDEIIKSVRILSEDVMDGVKQAAEGYGATLERIERDLDGLNRKMDERHADHGAILANHGMRLTKLERPRRNRPR